MYREVLCTLQLAFASLNILCNCSTYQYQETDIGKIYRAYFDFLNYTSIICVCMCVCVWISVQFYYITVPCNHHYNQDSWLAHQCKTLLWCPFIPTDHIPPSWTPDLWQPLIFSSLLTYVISWMLYKCNHAHSMLLKFCFFLVFPSFSFKLLCVSIAVAFYC